MASPILLVGLVLLASTLSLFLLYSLCPRPHGFPALFVYTATVAKIKHTPTIIYSDSYVAATSSGCRIDLSVMDATMQQQNPSCSQPIARTVREPLCVSNLPAPPGPGGKDVAFLQLRSTIPLRLDRKPPCRPTLLPPRPATTTAHDHDMAVDNNNNGGGRIPLPPPLPPPPPAKRPHTAGTGSVHSPTLEVSQHSPITIRSAGACSSSAADTGYSSNSSTCNCRKERVPFNGVPPLLATQEDT